MIRFSLEICLGWVGEKAMVALEVSFYFFLFFFFLLLRRN